MRVAERINFDNNWKVHRGRSLLVEGYKDEIASKKGKAASTLVHKHRWIPYGEREGEDLKKASYAAKLLELLKGVIGSNKSSSSELSKVMGQSTDAYLPVLYCCIQGRQTLELKLIMCAISASYAVYACS